VSNLIADLKAEMEVRNQRVRDLEERKAARIRDCNTALEAAKADRDTFAAQIAIELGLKKVGGGGRKSRPKPPEQGSKGERVLELYRQGKSRRETAEAMGISIASVYAHISDLRTSGHLVDVDPATVSESSNPDQDEPKAGPPEDAPEELQTIETQTAPSSERGSSKDDLLAAVARQQNGIRGKVVILSTTAAKGHRHTIRVDRMGDGHTTPDDSGHVHRCYRFGLSGEHGHTHNATVAATS